MAAVLVRRGWHLAYPAAIAAIAIGASTLRRRARTQTAAPAAA
jgi:hypothetical protein